MMAGRVRTGRHPQGTSEGGARFFVEGLTPLYAPAGNIISFYRRGADGYYDIYTVKPDGTDETCLTDNKPGLPRKHIGGAAWHPSGKYMAFVAEKNKHFGISSLSHPGSGWNCDIWLMTSDGGRFWQVTDLKTKMSALDKTPYTGVLHPHFSDDGSLISWGERIGPSKSPWKWGEWVIRLADFRVDGATREPRVENVRSYQPGAQRNYLESDDFSPDGSKLLICGNLEAAQPEFAMDIYTMDLETGQVTRLTSDGDYWDETGIYSPDGKNIVWHSSVGYKRKPHNPAFWLWGMTDFWVMDADGSNKRQVSFFNKPGTNDYELVEGRRVMCEHCSWSPDGKHLIAGIIVCGRAGKQTDEIAIIEMESSNVNGPAHPVVTAVGGMVKTRRIVGGAARICRENPRDFFGMSALVGAAPFLLGLLNMARNQKSLTSPQQGFLSIIQLALIAASFVLIFYMLGAFPVLTAYALAGRPLRWKAAFSWLRDRGLFWGVFLVVLLHVLAVLGGLLLLVVPGIAYGVLFMLAIPARVLGDYPGRKALTFSCNLVRPVLFRGALDLAGLLFLPWAILMAVHVVFGAIYGFTATSPVRVVPPAVLSYLIGVFWGPVVGVAHTLFYIERAGGMRALRKDMFLERVGGTREVAR
jgi:Tol biopolymer transport system component